MKIELTGDQISDIVIADLKSILQHLEKNLSESSPPCVFSMDPLYDRIMIKEHIRATKLILRWYES
jgi:hypothetical protein